MIEGLKASDYSQILPKFELVYWADIIYNRPLSKSEKDMNSPYYLDEKYIKALKYFPLENYYARRRLIDFIGRQINRIFLNEDFSLNYSFITDAILNRYFKDLEIYYMEDYTGGRGKKYMVKDLIRERLLRKLEEHRNDDIMLISHSMGSIIAFDVLTFIAPHIKINTFITIGSPLGLPVVISKIAAEHKRRLDGENHMLTPPSVYKSWYNFSDILDKIAFNYKLADDFSENSLGIKPVDFMVVNNYEINGVRNPHKSFGYLRTPEFSKVLNEFILAERLTLKQKIIRKTGQIIHDVKTQISIQLERKKST